MSREFVAAALAIDLRTPIYSAARAKLLAFVPDSYSVGSTGPVDLKDRVLAGINAAGAAAGAEAREFAERVRGGNALDRLKQDVEAYLAEIETAFADTSSAAYREQLRKQFDALVSRRALMRSRPELCNLIEGPLLPVPAN